MADSGIYATTAQVQYKAGTNASATSNTETYINEYVNQAEGTINSMCRRVFATTSGGFQSLPSTTRGILTDCAASLAAMQVITFDMSGFTSRTEAEDMLNVLRDAAQRDLKFLEDQKNVNFVLTGLP